MLKDATADYIKMQEKAFVNIYLYSFPRVARMKIKLHGNFDDVVEKKEEFIK